MTQAEDQRARRPVSYDTEPCEGRRASPSNPSGASPGGLSETVVLRCTAAEKKELKRNAAMAGLSISVMLRGSLSLIKPSRRRPAPKADPQLLAALSRMGTNLNQIAHAVNSARAMGDMHQLDALALLSALLSIDRQLSLTLARHAGEGGEGEAAC
ncbi:Bacterial mobilisation protein (MobC) [Pannonibacter phragmitetus]|uniref:Bacterial mobilisation protein (MobC) n=1 Tax=Pannonibacter phragmitetus TaxID=121719 RepID=A0A378ZQH7_9HYPH|nr:Bacterial mobilisation protein (MobC) [Pannonibacter phragmitetus]